MPNKKASKIKRQQQKAKNKKGRDQHKKYQQTAKANNISKNKKKKQKTKAQSKLQEHLMKKTFSKANASATNKSKARAKLTPAALSVHR